MIIAIDGHSACGKSTLAKDIATHLNCIYIDSGAMYRAVTLYLLENGVDFNNNDEIEQHLHQLNIQFIPGENPKVLLNNRDVTEEIRSTEVSEWVSDVAAISAVRKRLVQLQREISLDKSVVMDGRDIGSIVFPHADVKFFITATLEIRTSRRFEELKSNGINISPEIIKENLIKRDRIDSTRADSPLIKSPDAYVLDNSNLSRQEQTRLAMEIIQKTILHS